MDIDHFNEHFNSLSNALALNRRIMLDLMHHVFKVYNYFKHSEFRDYLDEVKWKVLGEDAGFRKYTYADIINDSFYGYNRHKLYEDIP